MITVDKLHKYLTKGSDAIPEREYSFRIPEVKMSDGHIYGKYVIDGKFSFLSKEIMPIPPWTELGEEYQLLCDKSVGKNSFTMSILNQVLPDFRYFNGKSRLSFVKDMYRQIAYDMEEKDLYRDHEYSRQRNHIRKELMEGDDIDNDELIKRVVIDYLSLTVYLLKRDSSKFGRQRMVEKIAFVPGIWKKTERADEYTIKNPTCILVEEEGRYKGIIQKNMNGVFSWQEDGMEDLFKELSMASEQVKKVKTKSAESKVVPVVPPRTDVPPNVTIPSEHQEIPKTVKELPKKITLAELQEIAEKEGISLTKKSDKTGKDIKKTIQELRDEITAKISL